MLDERTIAEIGVARLRLPIGAHKLLLVHEIADGLSGASRSLVLKVLLDWISKLTLESEIVEALAPFELLKDQSEIERRDLEGVISKPSLLSDAILDRVFGPVSIKTLGPLRHSGPAGPTGWYDFELDELSSGRHVPGLLYSAFRQLERENDLCFLKQWAFEFQVLSSTNQCADGQMLYFVGSEHRDAEIQIIGRKSHLARSAYLRALAYAVDEWEMPTDQALQTALLACAFDPFYLRMPPGPKPKWSVLEMDALTGPDPCLVVGELDRALVEQGLGRRLLHFNGPLLRNSRIAVDLELVTVLQEGFDIDAEVVLDQYQLELGRRFAPRLADGSIPVPCRSKLIPASESTALCLWSTFGDVLGYMHNELIVRTPYVPANFASNGVLLARPRRGGADLYLEGKQLGEISHWNSDWRPYRQKSLGPGCASATLLSDEGCEVLLTVPGYSRLRAWRVTVASREYEYGEWETKEFFATDSIGGTE